MKRSEMICKAAAYHMNVKDGVESHCRSMTLSGQDTTGEPTLRAKKGKFPNYVYVLPFDEAQAYMEKWIGGCCMYGYWLSWGNSVGKAYLHDKTHRYGEMNKGDIFYEVAFDIRHGDCGVDRVKIVFTKA